MAASIGRKGAIHGINITPLVDIFLVLLILVMISSTLVQPQGIEVQVPKAAAAGSVAPDASGLVLAADGSLWLDGVASAPEAVVSRIAHKVRLDSTHSVLVSADGKLPYEKVVEALDLVRKAGARKYALRVRTDV
ncbi:MAG TPA: biopolymer transporter ExbD [Fibrobacteria bacterium]|nr:biopolymer transporter ExbD [Fibrobacteria bacterium]HOX51771.1 biopolymer transporter ExbD [Fibrobacteria bacterium]